ncbi:MAG: NAD(P)H-dependent oxidoreductase subunit E [Ignavibacteria bacterium]|nr:NAD(P)H-dependent oxidoreductase subunit E [Ignavibacteria bacterium]
MVHDIVDNFIQKHPKDQSSLIGIMLDVQNYYYYLPKESLVYISRQLKIPISTVYNLATFYKAFSLKPKGKYPIAVCTGTACHVQGATKLLEKFERELNIKSGGETTKDKLFNLESVRCLGCCGLAPVVTVGKELHGKLPPNKVPQILKKYK